MAIGATIYRFEIALSDVDRGVYEPLDVRLARHPSETMRYLLTRTLAYCLLFQEGIAFSKGLSTTDEPPLSVRDRTGVLTTWVEIGTPAPERLHRASKAAPRVCVYTQNDPEQLRRSVRGATIHRASEIELYAFEPSFLDALDGVTERTSKWDLTHSDGQLYVTVGKTTLETPVRRVPLVDET
jgi:uncharacterized protein YaeQ